MLHFGFLSVALRGGMWVFQIDYSKLNFWVIFFIPLLYVINHFYALILGFSAFYIKDSREYGTIMESVQQLLNIFTGLSIPLLKIPLVGAFLTYLPFSLQFHHPTNIFLGNYTPLQTFSVFIFTLIYIFCLYFLAKIIFKIGLKRYESVGL